MKPIEIWRESEAEKSGRAHMTQTHCEQHDNCAPLSFLFNVRAIRAAGAKLLQMCRVSAATQPGHTASSFMGISCPLPPIKIQLFLCQHGAVGMRQCVCVVGGGMYWGEFGGNKKCVKLLFIRLKFFCWSVYLSVFDNVYVLYLKVMFCGCCVTYCVGQLTKYIFLTNMFSKTKQKYQRLA